MSGGCRKCCRANLGNDMKRPKLGIGFHPGLTISITSTRDSKGCGDLGLRPHMTRLAAPRVDAVVEALEDALLSLPPAEADLRIPLNCM